MNFSIINNISISFNRSNFTFIFFKVPCHANPGAVRIEAHLSSYISRDIFQKFSNTFKFCYSPKFFISKSLKNFFAYM